MIEYKDKKNDDITTFPDVPGTPFHWYIDVPYKADGITPDFDELFEALAKEEREAPPLPT